LAADATAERVLLALPLLALPLGASLTPAEELTPGYIKFSYATYPADRALNWPAEQAGLGHLGFGYQHSTEETDDYRDFRLPVWFVLIVCVLPTALTGSRLFRHRGAQCDRTRIRSAPSGGVWRILVHLAFVGCAAFTLATAALWICSRWTSPGLSIQRSRWIEDRARDLLC